MKIFAILKFICTWGCAINAWQSEVTSTMSSAIAGGQRCGIKTQDWPAGVTSTRPRANAGTKDVESRIGFHRNSNRDNLKVKMNIRE